MIKNLKFYLLLLGATLMVASCSSDEPSNTGENGNEYNYEQFRPQVHYTPDKFWVNDPNGMVYHNGVYHLFYQYNPLRSVWGNLSWGHATSKDLIHWDRKSVALTKDNIGGDIFSGSIVIDKDNTAGFGKDAMVAIYTSAGNKQHQCIAYSTDGGESFTYYASNPVLPNSGIADFRDPKVFWHEESNKWIMSLATNQTITFYSSADLKSWERLSSFGEGVGAHGGVWECPDLFELPIEGSGESKWVLLVSINPGGPAGGSATQYFIGDFDGTTFTADAADYPLWIDYGKDNYAGVTWNNHPDGKKVMIGWMSNWQYAGNVPTSVWRGAFTLPREFKLKRHNDKLYLTSAIIPELSSIASEWVNISANSGSYSLNADCAAYQLEITLDNSSTTSVELANIEGEKIAVTVNPQENKVEFNRNESGKIDFSSSFKGITVSPLFASGATSRLVLTVDQSSVECEINDMTMQTNIVFPASLYKTLTAVDGAQGVKCVKMRTLKSIWRD